MRPLTVRTYVIVCGVLIVLTIATVGLSFAPMASILHPIVGLLIAAIKASLVALFFMHLVESSRLNWIVVIVTMAWLGVLFVLTFTDYCTRELVPFMPGH